MRKFYTWVFGVAIASGVVYIAFCEPQPDLTAYLDAIAALGISVAVTALVIAEGMNVIMSVAGWIDKKTREIEKRTAQRKEALRQEGAKQFAQAQQEWREKQANGGTTDPEPTPESINYK